MIKYEIIVYWSADDHPFIAEMPEPSGCMAEGKSYPEALANAEVVIEEWIETVRQLGGPGPEPKGRLAYAWAIPGNLEQ